MKGIVISAIRQHKGLLVVSIIWIICIAAAFFGAVLRSSDAAALTPFAVAAVIPAVLGISLWPFIKNEWAQIFVILGWLCLAIVACLAVSFYPMAILFMCAPAAAALFEKEKVVEAMFLSVIFALLVYYAQQKNFVITETVASALQTDWSHKAAIVGSLGFLIAALYGAADSARYKYPAKGMGIDGQLLDAVPGGVIRVTGENNISFASDAAHSLFNLPSEINVLPVYTLFEHEKEQTALLDLIDRTRSTGRAGSRKFTLKDRGHLIHMDITSSPLGDDSALLHIADATAHEARIDALHVARAAAQNETEGKTLFFAGVSHELRTPLNAIIGFSDMMRSRLFGPLPGKYAEYADLIHDSGQHMLDLIGDVLDLTKVEAGKYELAYTMFDAADVVRSSIKMIRPTADAAEVQIEANITEEPAELLVNADRKAVRQMLLNLLSNAIKFTPKGGRIVVSARSVGNVLNVTVTDNGVGIDASELETIGQPFVQTASGKDSDLRGSGLGLSLVKSLCDLHGGRFVITSQRDKGTTADIYLPLSRQQAA
ncbi:MAG: sensor histidine kinase [Alphaproteobacteria bacterium]